MNYKRLTKRGGFSKDLDLSQELGYSHIYQRLSEIEDEIEDGEKGFLTAPRYRVGDEVFYLRFSEGDEPEIVRVLVKRIYIGQKKISYALEVGKFGWEVTIDEKDCNLFPNEEEARARLAELRAQGGETL